MIPVDSTVDDDVGVLAVELVLLDFLYLLVLPADDVGVVVAGNVEVGVLLDLDQVFEFVQVAAGLVGLGNVDREPEHPHSPRVPRLKLNRLLFNEIELAIVVWGELFQMDIDLVVRYFL